MVTQYSFRGQPWPPTAAKACQGDQIAENHKQFKGFCLRDSRPAGGPYHGGGGVRVALSTDANTRYIYIYGTVLTAPSPPMVMVPPTTACEGSPPPHPPVVWGMGTRLASPTMTSWWLKACRMLRAPPPVVLVAIVMILLPAAARSKIQSMHR